MRKYIIADGVHRCLVAWHVGKKTHIATVNDPDDEDIQLEEIVSPKRAEDISKLRLCECLALTMQGEDPFPIMLNSLVDYTDPLEWDGYPTIPELYSDVRILIENCR